MTSSFITIEQRASIEQVAEHKAKQRATNVEPKVHTKRERERKIIRRLMLNDLIILAHRLPVVALLAMTLPRRSYTSLNYPIRSQLHHRTSVDALHVLDRLYPRC